MLETDIVMATVLVNQSDVRVTDAVVISMIVQIMIVQSHEADRLSLTFICQDFST